MGKDVLDVAVIGLGTFGRQTLEALCRSNIARVVAIADRDARLAEQVGRSLDLPFYTDNRQLLLKARPAVMFLATPPMAACDLMEACAAQGVHVWKEAPLGRNLGEAAAMVRRFEAANLKLAVGTQRRAFQSYRRAYELRSRVGEVLLARGHYMFNWGPDLQWRADKQSSGGGALLELGYHPIDLLVWMLGLPEEAYGLTALKRPELADAQPPHDTDDTASAILRYKDDTMATILASRVSGPVSEEFALCGCDGSLIVSAEDCTLRNVNGDVLDHLTGAPAHNDAFARQAEAFLTAVAAGANTWPCSGGENLLNHAVIDAIYLAGRTCQPESPLRQLQIHGMEMRDCLQHAVTDEEK